MSRERPMLAPHDTLQQILYAAACLIIPRSLAALYYWEKVDLSWWILCGWWLVTFLYTIDWAIASYRKFRAWRVAQKIGGLHGEKD